MAYEPRTVNTMRFINMGAQYTTLRHPFQYNQTDREKSAKKISLGNDRFWKQVESTLGKRVGRRQRGRPPKHVDAPR
jgi:hypothetical protein